ncbi:hypothetical protein [Kribbella lupini]
MLSPVSARATPLSFKLALRASRLRLFGMLSPVSARATPLSSKPALRASRLRLFGMLSPVSARVPTWMLTAVPAQLSGGMPLLTRTPASTRLPLAAPTQPILT